MPVAHELVRLRPGLAFWQAYDKTVKADLFSTAVATKDGIFLVDPIELAQNPLKQLIETGLVRGIIVTNGNHFRSTDVYIRRFCVPVFAHRSSRLNRAPSAFTEITDGSSIGNELETTVVEGAGPGEIAVYHAGDGGGTLVVGDALINFDPVGLTFLPDKYCENAKQMRKSLRKLLRYDAERILFAHGTPILSGAGARLRQLLEADL